MPAVLSAISIISLGLFTAIISYYFIINLQWYDYNLWRVVSKHHKWQWHIYYFLIPVLACALLPLVSIYAFYSYVYVVLLPLFFLWYRFLDKRLVFTGRVKRFFILLAICFATFVISDLGVLCIASLGSLLFAFVFSLALESIFLLRYERMAIAKLRAMQDLRIIAITASYGKTSIKNFIKQILSSKFSVYATPRSVNTHKGLIADINKNLRPDYEIYIAEAGARHKGDIAIISKLLSQHYAVIGSIGDAHLEYFKDINTILHTKHELLQSQNLKKAFVYDISKIPDIYKSYSDKIISYNMRIKDVESTLDFTKFSMYIDTTWIDFATKILGKFNIGNIAASILIAREFGMSMDDIKKGVESLEQVEHRLYKISTDSKIILDDSFNGNLEGMSEAIRLSSLHNGRKVIVTPGLVESSVQNNITLAKRINDVFDLVVITGSLNAKILDSNISKEKILLDDKSKLQDVLASSGKKGDLVLFANDAPSFI